MICWLLALDDAKEEAPPPPSSPPRITTQGVIFVPQWLSSMNTNKDSKITFEEFSKYFRDHFQEADQDKNQILEKKEYVKFLAALKQKYLDNSMKTFEKADKDGDGRLSKEEARVDDKRFAELDQDKSGYLSKDEAMKGFSQNWDAHYNSFLHYTPYSFARMDTNSDGKVDIKELEFAIDSLFKWFDKNGDGAISPVDAELSRPSSSPTPSEEKKNK